MNVPQSTLQLIADALKQVVGYYAHEQESVLSDLYFQVSPATGQLTVFDDDDRELASVKVPAWRGDASSGFMKKVQEQLSFAFHHQEDDLFEQLPLLRPYSLVLVGDDHETLADLYLVDDDTILLPGGLMEGLEDDLNDFLAHLMDAD